MSTKNSIAKQDTEPRAVDARGEQEALDQREDLSARSAGTQPGGTDYDPEIWGYLSAACGALR